MAGPEWISAAEAASRLGIKQATLYSYVSRGVLTGAGPAAAAPAAVPLAVLAGVPAGRAAGSIPGRSRSGPAVAARAGRRAWPGW